MTTQIVERNGIEYDENTGLPKLPAGMYWQVKENYNSVGLFILVKEVKPKKFLGITYGETTELISHEDFYSYLEKSTLTDDVLKNKAEELYREFQSSLKIHNQIQALVGIYPPKKLS